MDNACNDLSSTSLKDICKFDSHAMYDLVKLFGRIPFKKSQKNYCNRSYSFVRKRNMMSIFFLLVLCFGKFNH